MATANELLLRTYLGEQIPEGGSDADTQFTAAEVTALLARNNNDPVAAAVEGWTTKAARYANLIDTSDGSSSVSLSQLHRQAVIERDHWSSTATPTGGTRIHKLVRRDI